MTKFQLYGYIRVSSKDQNEDRQIVALAPLNISQRNLYIDKQSGKDFNRPAYCKMMRRLKKGDLLVIKSIDRLGRNYTEIIEQWRIITKEKEADIRVLDMPLLDTTRCKDLLGTFIADLVLQVLSFTAQNERENIKQRQYEGIVAAKARGVRFGRPTKQLPENFGELFIKWKNGELTPKQMEEECGMTISAIYKKIRLLRSDGPIPRLYPPNPQRSGDVNYFELLK